MRNKTKLSYCQSSLSLSHLNPSTVLISLVILLESFPLQHGAASVYVPSSYPPVSPEMYRFAQHGHLQAKMKRSEQMNGENVGDTGGVELELHKSVENSELDEGLYGEQQIRQLLPTGLLLPRQFPKTDNSLIFNQANGPFVEKVLSEEAETNGRLGLFSVNDYDLPSKHVAARSRESRFGHFGGGGGGPTVKRSQNPSLSAREGYMCHFKLCQFGAGKRRWSPLFEFD